MGSERPRRAGVAPPEWESEASPVRRDSTASHLTWVLAAAALGLTALLGLLLITGPGIDEDGAWPPAAPTSAASPSATSTGSTAVSGRQSPAPRDMPPREAPVLGVPIGAVAISTDFDGRIVALDLDSGTVTRTRIRTGAFVSVDGRLVAQTGCGGWQLVEIPTYELGDNLIGCGSYQPIGQRGADVFLFARPDREGSGEVLMADGQGGVLAATLPEVQPSTYATVSEGRVLVATDEAGLVWIDAGTGRSTPYAEGRLIEAGPGGVLWSVCEPPADCEVWYGTPDEARVHRFAVESADGNYLARINHDGSRAVFFLDGDLLRIIEFESGHSRQVENPGIDWSTATWSPDGLWLLDPIGPAVIALNTLTGRSTSFAGIPGDVSPGWVALIEPSPGPSRRK